jgi:hypothetical protein
LPSKDNTTISKINSLVVYYIRSPCRAGKAGSTSAAAIIAAAAAILTAAAAAAIIPTGASKASNT